MKNCWKFILEKWEQEITTVLLVVLESSGSSPGRQGFKMVVAKDGSLYGSIGGGIMEHKLVEKARKMLEIGETDFFFKKQIHHKKAANNQSGLICSGEQTVVLCPVQEKHITSIEQLNQLPSVENGTLVLTQNSFSFLKEMKLEQSYYFEYKNDANWEYREQVCLKNVLHIIGCGHVGLAFSKLMSQLGFYVKIYDDRSNLNTMEQNDFAHEKIVTPYDKIDDFITKNTTEDYIVIMTFGYRGDKVALKRLLGKAYKYIGMMGSDAKIKQLFEELENEGFSKSELDKIHAPIGVPIYSKTPNEIAISIAAEIIRIKNQNLSTGRSY